MHYLILGLVSLYAGLRVLALRRRRLTTAAGPSPQLILRPAVLAVIAVVAVVGGAFLLAGGLVLVVRGD